MFTQLKCHAHSKIMISRTNKQTVAMQRNTSESGNPSRRRRWGFPDLILTKRKNAKYFHISLAKVVEEINLLKKFSNPHIIRFIEAFESRNEVTCVIFLIGRLIRMEYVDKKNGVQ